MLVNNKRTRIYDQQGSTQSKLREREKTGKETKKLIRLVILIFLVIVFLIGLVQVPVIFSKLSKPFPHLSGNFSNKTSLDLNFRTNILLASTDGKKLLELGLLSFAKGDRKLVLVKLSPQSKISGIKADYSFHDLFIRNSKAFDIDQLEAGMITSLGYPLDGYVVLTNGQKLVDQDFLERLIDNFYSVGFIFNLKSNKDYLDKNLKTNLSSTNANNLIWQAKSLTPDRINFISLENNQDQNGYLDLQSVSNKLGLLLADPSISKESAAVEIENRSSVEGVGNILKTLIANLGGNVLNVTKLDESEKTEILTKDKNSPLAKKLSEMTFSKVEIAKNSEISSDIKLIIGNDYAKFFNF